MLGDSKVGSFNSGVRQIRRARRRIHMQRTLCRRFERNPRRPMENIDSKKSANLKAPSNPLSLACLGSLGPNVGI
jgi:hypothetical protein